MLLRYLLNLTFRYNFLTWSHDPQFFVVVVFETVTSLSPFLLWLFILGGEFGESRVRQPAHQSVVTQRHSRTEKQHGRRAVFRLADVVLATADPDSGYRPANLGKQSSFYSRITQTSSALVEPTLMWARAFNLRSEVFNINSLIQYRIYACFNRKF